MTIFDDLISQTGNPTALVRAIALKLQPMVEQISDLEAGQVVAAAVADIADPATADAEECADKINELLTSIRAAGFLIGNPVADIADPSAADAEECAEKINEVLVALRANGKIET